MNITCTLGGQPSNDECSYAEQVYFGDSVDFDTTYATIDGPELCLTSPNVWYTYSAAYTGDLTVSAISHGSFDVRVAVYDGSDCSPSSSSMIGCDDDFGTEPDARVTFLAIAGHDYLIEVGGYNEEEMGHGTLTVGSGTTPPSSSNDECQNAKPISNVTNLPFSTEDATFDGLGVCMSSPNVWYCYTALCNGDVTVSLLGSNFDTMLAVYEGCSCYPTSSRLIECNDDFESSYQSQLTFTATAGNQYLIEVGGYGSDTGNGVLTISCEGAVVSEKPDLGDAPDSTNNFGTTMTAYSSPSPVTAHYPTVYNDGSGFGPYGPIHVNAKAEAYLGKKISGETEADTGFDDDGTNNIRPLIDSADRDEGDDGVVFPITLPDCGWTTFDYTVTIAKPGTDLWVNVWLDFNRDGDWDDTVACSAGSAPEWAVQNQFLFNLPAGLNQLTTPAFRSWNPKSGPQDIWMRITLSEQPWKGGSNPGQLGNGGSGPLTRYLIGETEDYLFTPETAGGTDCPLCRDYNGDGVIDLDDVAAFTAQWLANCP